MIPANRKYSRRAIASLIRTAPGATCRDRDAYVMNLIGCSESLVRVVRRCIGLTDAGRIWPEALVRLAVKLREDGKTCKQIAPLVGRTEQAVKHRLQQESKIDGDPRILRFIGPKTLALSLLASGATARHVAGETGLHLHTVYRYRLRELPGYVGRANT